MSDHGWDSVPASVLMPAVGETVNSGPFSVPKGAHAMTVCLPALAGTGATCKLQALYPDDSVATEVWADVSCFDPATGTLVALDGLLEGVATTLPTALTGGGVLRFVASETQVAATVTIKVVFHMMP
jgi:hypothetical protein